MKLFKQPKWMKKTLAASLALTMLMGGASTALADDDRDDREFEFEYKIKNEWEHPGKGKAKGKWKNKGNKNNKGHGNIVIKLDFEDLDEDKHWAMEYIAKLAAKQVFSGYDDGTFKPNKPVSRIEAVITAIRLMDLKDEAESEEEMNTELNFQDAKDIEKKYPNAIGYVAVALENDLFPEMESKLQPDKPADRLWATILLVKALGLDDEAKAEMNTKLDFKDAKEIPAGAVGYVAVAVEKGIVSGYDNNTFKPNKPVTRAELAVLLDRAGEELPDYNDNKDVGEITDIDDDEIEVTYGSTVKTYELHDDVYIHYKGDRLDIDDLDEGDEIIVRTYEDTVVFIEVKELHNDDRDDDDNDDEDDEYEGDFTLEGDIDELQYNSDGRLTSLKLEHKVDGKTEEHTFSVHANADIWGDASWLTVNQDVKIKGEDAVIESIELIDEDREFEVEGILQNVTMNSKGEIISVDLLQEVDDEEFRVNFRVEEEADLLGNPKLLVNGRTVVIKGEGITADSIEIDADKIGFVIEGTLEAVTLDTNGKLSTIALIQKIDGYKQTSIYKVASDVEISGDTSLLIKGQEVEIVGTNQTISHIKIEDK